MNNIILKFQPWMINRYGYDHGYGYGYGIFEIIFWILVLIGLAILVKYFLQNEFAPAFAQESAYDILKKRYAKGEISKEEFEDIKKDI